MSRSPSHTAAHVRPSIGVGATRWQTIDSLTITSAPSNNPSTGGVLSAAITLLGDSGNITMSLVIEVVRSTIGSSDS